MKEHLQKHASDDEFEGVRCMCKVAPESECQDKTDMWHQGVPEEHSLQLTESQCCEMSSAKFFTKRKAANPDFCKVPTDGTCCCRAKSLEGPPRKCLEVQGLPDDISVDVQLERREVNNAGFTFRQYVFSRPPVEEWFPGANVYEILNDQKHDDLWQISDWQGASKCVETISLRIGDFARVGGKTWPKEYCTKEKITLACPDGKLYYDRIAQGKPLKGWGYGCGYGMVSNHSESRCMCN